MKTVMLTELIASASAAVVSVEPAEESDRDMAFLVTVDTPFDGGSGRITVEVTAERAKALGLTPED
jgi:hypothetical protein